MRTYNHLLVIILFVFVASCGKSSENPQPKVPRIVHTSALPAGWYNQDAAQLNQELDDYLAQAHKNFNVALSQAPVKALIVPHAGYFYSGLCAATAYQTLQPSPGNKNTTIKRVIILAPSHTAFYNGIALPDYTVYRNTLGEVQVDTEAVKKLKKDVLFRPYALAHKHEHAIEMHLPFLQKTIAEFKIVPLVVGHLTLEEPWVAAHSLSRMLDDETLLVISTDFTHHGESYQYQVFDKNIIAQLRHLDSYALSALNHQSLRMFYDVLEKTGATICGREPLKILLAILEREHLGPVQAKLGCYYTSAHVAAARTPGTNTFNLYKLLTDIPDAQAGSSVSYVSLIFTPPQAPGNLEDLLTGYEKKSLLHCARATLHNAFKPEQEKCAEHELFPAISPGLTQPAGVFVTLNTKKGQLRGCIGRITTPEPLVKTVHDMALAAAFHDSRFSPLTAAELDDVVIDISILTPPAPVQSSQDIVIGKHGIILNKLNETGQITASAVFLPQVPQQFGWDLETTLQQLSLKAGLARDAWQECAFEVFEGFEIKE